MKIKITSILVLLATICLFVTTSSVFAQKVKITKGEEVSQPLTDLRQITKAVKISNSSTVPTAVACIGGIADMRYAGNGTELYITSPIQAGDVLVTSLVNPYGDTFRLSYRYFPDSLNFLPIVFTLPGRDFGSEWPQGYTQVKSELIRNNSLAGVAFANIPVYITDFRPGLRYVQEGTILHVYGEFSSSQGLQFLLGFYVIQDFMVRRVNDGQVDIDLSDYLHSYPILGPNPLLVITGQESRTLVLQLAPLAPNTPN